MDKAIGRLSVLVIAAAGLAACSCGDGNGRRPGEAAVGKAAETPSSARIAGRWRMTSEEPADGKGGFFGQKRRLLEIRADGTFRFENYVSAWEDAWRLEGDVLVLRRSVDQAGATVEDRVVVERADEQALVLVEDLPEVYQGDGPPRKVRNTYRRVSEAELGPMLGAKVATSAPEAGVYAATYDYSMSKYPTMEICVTHSIRGAARLELGADGSAAGCFGVASLEHFSESRYSSHDGKDRSDDHEYRTLLGAKGRWSAKGDAWLVKMDRFWSGRCDTSVGEGDVMGPLELECTALAKNERLPVAAIGCLLVAHHSYLDHLAINPADTERSGPYVLQSEPMGHISTDQGRPWLLLGDPGLAVRSVDDRSHESPEVSFKAGETRFLESDYR